MFGLRIFGESLSVCVTKHPCTYSSSMSLRRELVLFAADAVKVLRHSNMSDWELVVVAKFSFSECS